VIEGHHPMNDPKSDAQQTLTSFRDKWVHNPDLAFAETIREGSDIFNWILNRNGFKTASDWRSWLAGRKHILDAGCGNGRVTALMLAYAPPAADVMGIDLAAAAVARANFEPSDRVAFREKDLLGDLDDLGFFDLIYCQEVLHHTGDPARAFLNLCRRLAPGGEIAIYVYKTKAPVREFADDYIRDHIAALPYDDAMRHMRQVTEFGKALSSLNAKVTVPAVDVLGIEPGEYDVQRLLYFFFLKCFWNADLGFEASAAINYDWYHPQLCSRHTVDEVEQWFVEAGLDVVHRHVDPYGITYRGVNPTR
jgi:SAM-dependent methyltransferase